MNWSEAIKAMVEGKKVRAKHGTGYIYISQDNSTSEGAYKWSQFTKFDWEIYEEPVSYEGAVKAIMDKGVDENGQGS